jgi:choline dehydrogenase
LEHDVVIVGAGSAGATLAGRLTETGGLRVALIEAGPDYRAHEAPEAMALPNPARIILEPELARFRYDGLNARRTKAQEPRVYWRGRGLGGSSAINGQIAIRPVPEDLDDWAAAGCTGWSFAETLPYFKRLETDLRYGDAPYHGADGPIPIYRAPINAWGAVDRVMAETALDMGHAWAPDHNAPGALGVSPYAINSRAGRRVSTNDAYLEPARGRNTLNIVGDALVDRVIFEGGRAVAVRVLQAGAWREVRGREIVLAAGAIHSPAILMRSGVGPADDLAALGIKVRVDLPVGRRFQDHPGAFLTIALDATHVPPPGFRHTNCCVRYSSGLAGAGPGDMMIVGMNRFGDSIGRHLTGPGLPDVPMGLIGVWVNQCLSRGRLTLASADPEIEPIVEENMLDDPSDLIRMRDGVRRLIEIARHPATRALGAVAAPGLDITADPSDADIDRWVLATAGDTQHATSTCPMGGPDDRDAVVDPECRVVGTEGLRVIDASIMPSVPRANTHLATVMIAERMAERMRA